MYASLGINELDWHITGLVVNYGISNTNVLKIP